MMPIRGWVHKPRRRRGRSKGFPPAPNLLLAPPRTSSRFECEAAGFSTLGKAPAGHSASCPRHRASSCRRAPRSLCGSSRRPLPSAHRDQHRSFRAASARGRQRPARSPEESPTSFPASLRQRPDGAMDPVTFLGNCRPPASTLSLAHGPFSPGFEPSTPMVGCRNVQTPPSVVRSQGSMERACRALRRHPTAMLRPSCRGDRHVCEPCGSRCTPKDRIGRVREYRIRPEGGAR